MMRILTLLVVLSLGVSASVSAQGRHARKEAERAAALRTLQQIPRDSGSQVQVKASLKDAYESLVTFAKRRNLVIDLENSSVEGSQLVTEVYDIAQDGRITEKGKRLRVDLMKDDPGTTTLRVIVEDLKIKRMMSGASWKGPVNDSESQALALEISSLFQSPEATVAQQP